MSTHDSPIARCSVDVIESVHSTRELVVAAARAIIADAEFNGRVASLKSSSAAAERTLLELLDQYEALIESCNAAWTEFEADPRAAAPALLAALAAVQELERSP